MDCPEYSIVCRLDELVKILGSGPSGLDLWSVVIAGVGTLASSVIAVVAIVLSTRAASASRRQSKEVREAEARRRRADLAHDMSMWFSDGTVFMLAELTPVPEFARWADRGDSILFRANSFEDPGAGRLMAAAKEVRALVMKKEPLKLRVDAAIHASRMFKVCAERWVSDPGELGEMKPESWVDDSWFKQAADGDE